MTRHWSFTRMLCCPWRSPCNNSRWFPGGTRKSARLPAISSCRSFRRATRSMLMNLATRSPPARRSVLAQAKDYARSIAAGGGAVRHQPDARAAEPDAPGGAADGGLAAPLAPPAGALAAAARLAQGYGLLARGTGNHAARSDPAHRRPARGDRTRPRSRSAWTQAPPSPRRSCSTSRVRCASSSTSSCQTTMFVTWMVLRPLLKTATPCRLFRRLQAAFSRSNSSEACGRTAIPVAGGF